jgi:hypothetical protein
MASAYKFRYVAGTVDNSCVPACIAMIVGKTLRQVLKEIHEHWEDTGKTLGLEDGPLDQYLAANGFAVQRIHHDYTPNKLLIKEWPIAPFAPIHIVDVWSSNPPGMHATIMDSDGIIYDPANKKIKSIQEYHRVFAIAGIWQVSAQIPEVLSIKKTK